MAKPANELTPMQRQYHQIKEQNQDCILFFRLGDFYEMFDEDAVLASRELDLTLTTRDRSKPKEEQTPMCGVPYHSVDAYIARLVAKGYKVAICEQMSDPATTKGLVEREITRTVTPGTVTESCMLEESKNKYCAGLCGGQKFGLAFCDISTGAFYVTACTDAPTAISELGRFAPSEILRFGEGVHTPAFDDCLLRRLNCCVNEGKQAPSELAACESLLERHFDSTLSNLGLAGMPEAIIAAGTLLDTLLKLQKNDLAHIRTLEYYTTGKFMELDLDARRNLELVETMRSKEKKGSLLWVLDKTHTAMGGRMLRSWLEKPLLDPVEIGRRHSAVEDLVDSTIIRSELEEALKDVSDLERVMTRIVTGTVNCRDLLGLARGLRALPEVKNQLSRMEAPLLRRLEQAMDPLTDCADRIESTIVDDPPITVREGGIIRPGANAEADRLRDIMNGGKDTIIAIETAEREKTGIRTLKVSFNRVFGYYIEVSKSFMDQVPPHYIRKQTLANCERYITPELKELEDQVLNAKDRLTALEYQIFTELREYLAQQASRVQLTASAVAAADTLCSLASVAVQRGYCRPEITLGNEISIDGGRHPVVEVMLKDSLFVPNDTHLGDDHQVAIITGPNMAGKSTYMRQVALIVLMAQIGSFVPARSARIGLVDRVFTRIGASDDLASGQSTFMVEMSEVASILKYATSRSLLILDEIGRGTSTYDGMAIARAVLEFAANPRKLGAKTLFATHYHELSTLESKLSNVKNYNIAVKKRGDQMIFLRKIVPGATDDSYGVEVAKLAGLPGAVITRAREILQELEAENGVVRMAAPAQEEDDQISMMDLSSQQIRTALEAITVETLTPIEAMNELYKLKKMLNG